MYREISIHSKNLKNKNAVIHKDNKCTYQELYFLVEKINLNLSNLDIKRGDVIAVSNKNFFHFIAATISLYHANIICLPLTNDNDLAEYLLKETNTKFILNSENESYDSRFIIKISNYYNKKIKFPSFIKYNKNNAPLMMFPTSGTSSNKKKIVIQGKKAILSTQKYITEFMKLNSSLTEFIGSPPDNVFWFGRIRCCLAVGGTIILNHNATNPLVAINEIKKNKCNAITGDTSFHLMLLKYFNSKLISFSPKIRWIKLSSQAISESDLRTLFKTFSKAKIIMGYGLSEAMRTTLINYKDDLSKLNSVGLPQKGVAVKILRPKKNVIHNKNQIGEILIKGDNLALGYFNSNIDTKKKFKNGWFYTGDYGYKDKDGYLYFESRKDLMINIGGKSYSSNEIHSFIVKKLKKTDSIIIGIENIDTIKGAVPVLLIEKNVYSKSYFEKIMLKSYSSNLNIIPFAVYYVGDFARTKNGKIVIGKLPKNIKDLKPFVKIWSK